jgi:hypothetical protein
MPAYDEAATVGIAVKRVLDKARSREEGKKLTWGDGVVATKILVQVRLHKAITDRRARLRGTITHRS